MGRHLGGQEAQESVPPRSATLNTQLAGGDAVSVRQVTSLWLPLAASWLCMALELPIVIMAIARLPHAEVNLAAQGGLVMPVALLLEAPIMMLLTASTALCRDVCSWRLVRRVMMTAGAAITVMHALLAFTSLHDVVALQLVGVPEAVVEPARLGLQIMLPWTWAIAYRRFHQGLLIRAGQTRPIVVGTIIRLGANAIVLVCGVAHGGLPGVAVGAAGIVTGVMAEAVFIGLVARPAVKIVSGTEGVGLTLSSFLGFYLPLAATQLLSLVIPPLAATALARMPEALPSLAAWPAAWSFTFLLRSGGYALNEVVVSLLDRPHATRALRTFTLRLAGSLTLFLVVFVASPLASAWFGGVSGLPDRLAGWCRIAVALGLLLPALGTLEMWFQGRLVHARRTKTITVGMLLHVSTAILGFALGVVWAPLPGIWFTVLVLTSASLVKTCWLGWSCRAV